MKVRIETIVRLVVLGLTVLNTVLGYIGIAPVDMDEHMIYTVISAVAIIFIPAYTAWKNNSITTPALIADAYLKELRKISNELEEGEGNDITD